MIKTVVAVIVLTLCFALVLSQSRDLYEGDVCKTVKNGTSWTCKKLKDCPKAIKLLESEKEPQTCGFKEKEVIVCCEPGVTVNVSQPTENRQSPKVSNKADEMCKKYSEYVYVRVSFWETPVPEMQKVPLCDNLDSLIVGGQNAKRGEFPHMAQLGYGPNMNNIKWNCGGSLISEKYILSAAHCTDGLDPRWVRLGAHTNAKKTGVSSANTTEIEALEKPVIYKIVKRLNHPNYTTSKRDNDIALYELEKEASFDNYVRPACLQTEKTVSNSFAVATGWGATGFAQKASALLQKVNLTLSSEQDCREHYSTVYNPDSMFCAGNDNKDTCQGDSGGPLQLQHKNFYCMYSLLGVTSFGKECATAPGIYTRVSSFVSWIESVVWP